MKLTIDTSKFRIDGSKPFRIAKAPTGVDDKYKDKDDYSEKLVEFQKEIDALQNKMYAHDRYGLLVIFQAMDAAGKDGTIQKVMSGINPHGVTVSSFKRPSDEELDHDFLWRTNSHMPQRGRIGIFNRSYYEEVLVVRVHPEILTKYQRVPAENVKDLGEVWKLRYQSMRELEAHNHRNGIHTLKFFLNVSKKEQAKRFLDRLNTPEKNWKFNEGDINERAHWDEYMAAYEDAINDTATKESPWYAVPADDKKTMRLIVCKAILEKMESLDTAYPEVNDEQKKAFVSFREALEKEI
jgi:PPK2 family polyphosphate:nucleotide phosphotransferase